MVRAQPIGGRGAYRTCGKGQSVESHWDTVSYSGLSRWAGSARISEVAVEGHPLHGRPVPDIEAGRRANMFNAARPGSMVSLVVLRAEGLQAKPFGHKLTRHGEAIGNQLGSGHISNLQPTPTAFRTIADLCGLESVTTATKGSRTPRRSTWSCAHLAPLCVKGSRRGLFYGGCWRVREVTVPKCQLSGLGWPRWMSESLPGVLPGPPRRLSRRRSSACRPHRTVAVSTPAWPPWRSCPRPGGGRSSGVPRYRGAAGRRP